MSRTDREAQIRALISDELGVELDDVTLSSTIESLGGDSLDTVEAVMRIEEEFGIEIPDDDAEKFKTISDIVQYVESHQ